MSELSVRIADNPRSLGLLEVWPTNLGDVLAWLAKASVVHPHARFAALLDSELQDPDAVGAIAEAGAVEIAHSPRDLHHVLLLGRQHAARAANSAKARTADQSLAAWAWRLLPWQDA